METPNIFLGFQSPACLYFFLLTLNKNRYFFHNPKHLERKIKMEVFCNFIFAFCPLNIGLAATAAVAALAPSGSDPWALEAVAAYDGRGSIRGQCCGDTHTCNDTHTQRLCPLLCFIICDTLHIWLFCNILDNFILLLSFLFIAEQRWWFWKL